MIEKTTIPAGTNAIISIDYRRRPSLVACLPTMPGGLVDSVENEPDSAWSDDFNDSVAPGTYYARMYYDRSGLGIDDDAWLEIDLLGPCLDGGKTAFLVADMQLARTLLTAAWRTQDAAGESMGRSTSNIALETAMAFIDAHFDKNPALQAELDRDRVEFVGILKEVVTDRRMAQVAAEMEVHAPTEITHELDL